MLHRLLRGTAFTGTAAKINTTKNNTLQQTQKPAATGSCAYISAKLTFSSLCAGCRTIIVGVCYSFPALIEAATFSALVGGGGGESFFFHRTVHKRIVFTTLKDFLGTGLLLLSSAQTVNNQSRETGRHTQHTKSGRKMPPGGEN